MIPLVTIPPPIMTPREIFLVSMLIDTPMSVVAQIKVPVRQRPVPMMIFNPDPP